MGIETAAIAATVIGTAVSAYGAIQQGQAQSAARNYQAAVDRNNAQIAEWNAERAKDLSDQRVQAQMRAGTQRLAAQRAALGAAGVTLDSGSALDVQTTTAEQTAIETQNTDYQGQLAAYGYRTQGANYRAQAGLDSMAADNASTAGYANAGSTLLSGAGQVADRWYRFNKPGYGIGYGGS
jgi:hypothetical protein